MSSLECRNVSFGMFSASKYDHFVNLLFGTFFEKSALWTSFCSRMGIGVKLPFWGLFALEWAFWTFKNPKIVGLSNVIWLILIVFDWFFCMCLPPKSMVHDTCIVTYIACNKSVFYNVKSWLQKCVFLSVFRLEIWLFYCLEHFFLNVCFEPFLL